MSSIEQARKALARLASKNQYEIMTETTAKASRILF